MIHRMAHRRVFSFAWVAVLLVLGVIAQVHS